MAEHGTKRKLSDDFDFAKTLFSKKLTHENVKKLATHFGLENAEIESISNKDKPGYYLVGQLRDDGQISEDDISPLLDAMEDNEMKGIVRDIKKAMSDSKAAATNQHGGKKLKSNISKPQPRTDANTTTQRDATAPKDVSIENKKPRDFPAFLQNLNDNIRDDDLKRFIDYCVDDRKLSRRDAEHADFRKCVNALLQKGKIKRETDLKFLVTALKASSNEIFAEEVEEAFPDAV